VVFCTKLEVTVQRLFFRPLLCPRVVLIRFHREAKCSNWILTIMTRNQVNRKQDTAATFSVGHSIACLSTEYRSVGSAAGNFSLSAAVHDAHVLQSPGLSVVIARPPARQRLVPAGDGRGLPAVSSSAEVSPPRNVIGKCVADDANPLHHAALGFLIWLQQWRLETDNGMRGRGRKLREREGERAFVRFSLIPTST